MIWVLLLILCSTAPALAANVQADPTSPLGNVDALCEYVANGLSMYGEKFVRYPLPESCRDYRGVGKETLEKFNRQDLNCYKDIAPAMCALQFVDYEPSPTCKNTNDFFFKLLETCKKGNSMSSSYANCASFEHVTKTIGDPESFCSSSYLRTDYGSTAEGLPEGSTMKTFENTEKKDCKRIAESYNACMVVAVGKLGYSEYFCNGGGFGAYCQKFPTVVNDVKFKRMCENLVIPYVMEMNQQTGNRSNYCANMYTNYHIMLTAKKNDATVKAKAAKGSLASVQKGTEMINHFKKTVVELAQDNTNLDKESTILLNRMRQLIDQKMMFDHNIKTQFQRLVEATAEAETRTKDIEYTKPQGATTDEDLEVFSRTRPTIEAVIRPQKEALGAVREIQRMIDTGGHVSYAGTFGFFPIEAKEIEAEHSRIKKLSESVQQFAASYSAEIDKLPRTETAEELQIRSDGKKYAELQEIYASQAQLLTEFQRFGSQSGNPVGAAMGAAAKYAEKQARTVYA